MSHSKHLKIAVLTLVLGLFGNTASAAIYGSIAFPNGIGPLGFPRVGTWTYSATSPADYADIQAFSVASSTVAPPFPNVCTPLIYNAGPVSTINSPVGTNVNIVGDWFVYCAGIWSTAGAHVFFLDNGESFADASLVFWF